MHTTHLCCITTAAPPDKAKRCILVATADTAFMHSPVGSVSRTEKKAAGRAHFHLLHRERDIIMHPVGFIFYNKKYRVCMMRKMVYSVSNVTKEMNLQKWAVAFCSSRDWYLLFNKEMHLKREVLFWQALRDWSLFGTTLILYVYVYKKLSFWLVAGGRRYMRWWAKPTIDPAARRNTSNCCSLSNPAAANERGDVIFAADYGCCVSNEKAGWQSLLYIKRDVSKRDGEMEDL
jgi:hypothetical protein